MGKFRIEITDIAKIQIEKHYKSVDQASIKKIEKIFIDLVENPFIGVGKPEQLKDNLSGFWSRMIKKKDRLIYSINEDIVVVDVVSAIGHYGDK